MTCEPFTLDSMDFHRARTTFYRVASNRSQFGWLYEVTRHEVEILVEPHMKMACGEESLFQVFGSKHDAFFRATLLDCRPFETPIDGDSSNLMTFRRQEDLRFEKVSRDARRGIHGLPASFEPSGQQSIEVILQDACNAGLGFITKHEIAASTVGALRATFGEIEILLQMEVKYCRALANPTNGGFQFRIGATAEPGDRISAAAWRRFNAYGSPEYPI